MVAKTKLWLKVLSRKVSGRILLVFWIVVVTTSATINIYLSSAGTRLALGKNGKFR